MRDPAEGAPKDDVLQQVGQYRAPTQLPSISMHAFSLYEAAGFVVTSAAIAELEEALEALGDDLKALTDANVGLGVFALYLRDTRQDAGGAEMIVQLMRRTAPRYASIFERITAALQDVAIAASSVLDRFTARDGSAKARAPKYDSGRPAGTIPLKALKPMGELPRPKLAGGSPKR